MIDPVTAFAAANAEAAERVRVAEAARAEAERSLHQELAAIADQEALLVRVNRELE